MKVLWKGSISFGLVNIPIQLFTATESHTVDFTLLHKTCHTPLQYHRWCPHCDKEVSWDETVKGIKDAHGKEHIFTKEMLKALHPKKGETIDIIEFVDAQKIPIIYLNHHYYVAPTRSSDKAYALFVQALKKTEKAAIGHFVLRDKEYICALQSYEQYLLLTTLHYPQEIKGLHNLALPKKVPNANELKLAQELIEKLSAKSFTMSQFKDTFAQKVKKIVQAKVTKRSSKPKAKKEVATRTKRVSLVQSLHASLKKNMSNHPVRRAMAKKR